MNHLSLIALAAVLATPVHADTRTWSGAAGTPEWSAVRSGGLTNWTHQPQIGQSLVEDGDRLVFVGQQGLRNRNDYLRLTLGGLSFALGAGRFEIGGNALRMAGDVRNVSGVEQRLSLPLLATSDQTWDGGSGGLVLGAWGVEQGALRLAGKLKFSEPTLGVHVGSTGRAHLLVDGGRQVRSGALGLGVAQGASGRLRLSGTDTRWEVLGELQVGVGGMGQVEVTERAQLQTRGGNVNGSGGLASQVMGEGSLWDARGAALHVGSEGLVAVTQGGTLQTSGLSLRGGMQLSGADSLLQDSVQLSLGGGQLAVTAGARARLRQLHIGADAGSSATLRVEDVGSRLDADAAHVYSGGQFSLGTGAQAQIGSLQARAGSRLAIGAGSVLDAGSLVLESGAFLRLQGGRLQAERFNQQAGAQLDWQSGTLALPSLRLGGPEAPMGASLVLEADQVLALRDTLHVAADGLLALRQGSLLQAGALNLDGGTVVRQSGSDWQLGALRGHGVLVGGARLGGDIDPGSAGQAGSLDFAGGDLHLTPGSILRLDLLGGASFDRLAGIGQLQLDGTLLQLHLDAGLAAGRYAVLDFASLGGAYSVQVLGLAASRVDASRIGLDGTVSISAVPEPMPALLLALGLAALALRRRQLDSAAT